MKRHIFFTMVYCFLVIGTQPQLIDAAQINFDFTAQIIDSSGIYSGANGFFTGGAFFEERTGGTSNPHAYYFLGSPFRFYADIPVAPIDFNSLIFEVGDDVDPFGDYVHFGWNDSNYIYTILRTDNSTSDFSGNDIPDISVLNSLNQGLFSVYSMGLGDYVLQASITSANFNAVPLPTAVLLFASGLIGLMEIKRKFQR